MAGVDWSKVGEELRGMGGWENTAPRPNPDHGAAPIADRPGCWTSPVRVPDWLKGQPEVADAVPTTTDDAEDEAALVRSYMYGGL